MPKNSLTPGELKMVVEGLLREEYHLLLGAGASLGCQNGAGQPLPSGPTLADDLVKDFSVETEGEAVDLRTAYELVDGRTTKEGLSRSAYIKLRFSGCEPTWQRSLVPFRWKRAWTLNVDDVIERAFNSSKTDATQKPVPYSWSSLYREPERSEDELQVIHLHGYAPALDTGGEDLVFSIVEYLQASAHQHAWHHVFGDEFRQRPFIVVGAKLTDEYDLAEFLRRGNTSMALSGRPSLIVLKTITQVQKEQFRKWGLLPVQSDAASFFEFLAKAKAEIAPHLGGVVRNPKASTDLPREARIFNQQFHWLRLEAQSASGRDHDFYQGDQPEWGDILSDQDARFEVVDQVLSRLSTRSEGHEKRQLIVCLNGPRGAGKTAILLRCCRQMMPAGHDVFAFRGEERLDIESTHWWLENGPPCVLLFDGLADFAADVGRLAQQCRETGAPLLVIAAERDSRRHQVYQGISPEFLIALPENGELRLTDGDIDSLIEKLDSAHRLGALTRRTLAQRREYFVRTAKRQLLIGMMDLEGGKGFVERVRDEYTVDVGEPRLRAIYALSCMAYNFGYHLPQGIAMAAAGVSSAELTSSLRPGGRLATVLRSDAQGLRPRHRVIAATIVNSALPRDERFTLLGSLIRSLAPYVSLRTLQQNTLPYRILKQLMDEKIVYGWIGLRSPELYAGAEDIYGWNVRYWEQRALCEARIGSFPKAISFSEEALRIRHDAFTLTTAGSILLRMATDYYPGNTAESVSTYWRGVVYLRQARDLGEGRYEHPFNSFFARTIQFARRGADEARDPRLLDEWQRWMRDAERSAVFGHQENYLTLRGYLADWLRLTVGRAVGP